MKKRIVILALTLGYGGIEKYISSLCKMFKNDYSVRIICNYKELEKPAFNYYNASIEYLINHGFSSVSVKELIKKRRYIKAVIEFIKRFRTKHLEKSLMKKKVKNLDCDVVITTRLSHNKIVNKHLKNKKILKIATEHNSYDIALNYDKNICNSVSNYDYLVLVSKTQKKHYDKMFERCVYIPNVIDQESPKLSNLDSLNLISVGRFSPEKGFLDLIKVMQRLVKNNNKIKLYLIGDGYQKKEITNLISELKLDDNVFLPGYKSQEELHKYYLKSSLYVMTSHHESFGIVLLEAMSHGVPCIAFDSAKGAKEILIESGGILVKNRDINAMSSATMKLLDNKSELLKLQDAGVNYVKKYTSNKVRKKWIALIDDKTLSK